MRTLVLLAVVLLVAIIGCSEARNHKGKVTIPAGQWVLVSRFYFGGDRTKSRNITYTPLSIDPLDGHNLTFAIFDDQPSSWPSVWKERKTIKCHDVFHYERGGRMDATVRHVIHINETYPREWYMVLGNCDSDVAVTIKYDILSLNTGGKHKDQFSLEEQGYYGLYIAYFILFMLLLVAQGISVYQHWRAGSFQFIVKLLTVAIILEFFAMMFYMSHYASYAKNGIGSNGARIIGDLLDFIAQILLVLLLILLAKGYAISRVDLEEKRTIFIALGLLIIGYFVFFIWKEVEAHKILYPLFPWGSATGIILLIIRVLVLVYFLWSLRASHTVEGDPSKRQFYVMFGAMSFVWFVFLPLVVILVALSQIGRPYNLEKSVVASLITIDFIAFLLFVFLFWPSRMSKYFEIGKPDLLIGSTGSSSPYETL